MKILGKLFGSEARVKILRLFLFNANTVFTLETIVERSRVTAREAREEVSLLKSVGMIRSKPWTSVMSVMRKGKLIEKRSRQTGFILDTTFIYLKAFQDLLINNIVLHDHVVEKIHSFGKMKLFITAGVFINNPESRVDMLLVGDDIRTGALENLIHALEAEIGKELRYAAFETPDFNYRLGMYDKLVRDILDFPHIKVLNKLGIE